MDGNRRWARKRSLHTLLGHREGIKPAKIAMRFCIENKIAYLSLYTLSIENFFNRPTEEVGYLFDLVENELAKELDEFVANNIRIRFLGDWSLYPSNIAVICKNIEQQTAHCVALNLNLLLCYGARQEMVNATKSVQRAVASGTLNIEDLTVDTFKNYLWTAGMPDPDMVVRTGGVHRTSNFLLYQSAYSEFYFIDALWPDLTEEHLKQAVAYFNQCKRNFGN